jgi:hypothetical protein
MNIVVAFSKGKLHFDDACVFLELEEYPNILRETIPSEHHMLHASGKRIDTRLLVDFQVSVEIYSRDDARRVNIVNNCLRGYHVCAFNRQKIQYNYDTDPAQNAKSETSICETLLFPLYEMLFVSTPNEFDSAVRFSTLLLKRVICHTR